MQPDLLSVGSVKSSAYGAVGDTERVATEAVIVVVVVAALATAGTAIRHHNDKGSSEKPYP